MNKQNYSSVHIKKEDTPERIAQWVKRALEIAHGYVLVGTTDEDQQWLRTGTNMLDLIMKIEKILTASREHLFPWNEQKEVTRAKFDRTGTGSTETYTTHLMSLKEKLKTPDAVRIEDYISDIGIGIAMIMDQLEKR